MQILIYHQIQKALHSDILSISLLNLLGTGVDIMDADIPLGSGFIVAIQAVSMVRGQ